MRVDGPAFDGLSMASHWACARRVQLRAQPQPSGLPLCWWSRWAVRWGAASRPRRSAAGVCACAYAAGRRGGARRARSSARRARSVRSCASTATRPSSNRGGALGARRALHCALGALCSQRMALSARGQAARARGLLAARVVAHRRSPRPAPGAAGPARRCRRGQLECKAVYYCIIRVRVWRVILLTRLTYT